MQCNLDACDRNAMMLAPLPGLDHVCAFPGLSSAAQWCKRTPSVFANLPVLGLNAMNLAVIVSDTFRWDYLGAYGNDWIETPNLDALAAESALYLDAFAEGLPTIPARRVIMTGRNIFPFQYRPQPSDGVQLRGWHPLFDEDVTLAERLLERGYCTALFNDVYHMMKPGKNFHRGFEQWFWIRGQEGDPYAPLDERRVADMFERARGGRELRGRPWIVRHLNLRKDWKSDADTVVAQTMTAASRWLREYSLGRPFYLHVERFDPHEPWDPPAEYAEKYKPDYGDSLDGCITPGDTSAMTDEQVANARAAYAGEVTLVDTWVGRLLDTLRETGRMEDTIVVFTSDHGCMMGEHGQIHKGCDRLRNQVTQLPLLIRHPGGEYAGERVAGFCQHQDIMPTALRMLGEPVPERVLGRDIWPATADPEQTPDYVVSGFGNYACYRTKQWNYVRLWADAHLEERQTQDLYDLEADPEELVNVLDEHRDLAEGFSSRLEEHIRKCAPLTVGSFQSRGEAGEEMSFDALPRLDA